MSTNDLTNSDVVHNQTILEFYFSMKKSLKVYFLGAGMISVPVLQTVFDSDEIELVGIGTQPDRLAGRKKELVPTPVGKWAIEKGVEIDKPESVNSQEFLEKLHKLKPDFILVISFGQLLKEEILNLPQISCVNIHASLLPQFRGASPIIAALLNQCKKTGISFMKMDKGLDTGPVYKMFEHTISSTERCDELEMNLGQLGANNVVSVLKGIANGEIKETPQDDSKSTYTGKVRKSDGVIDWSISAPELVAKVKAYYPWPGATFRYEKKKGTVVIRITEAETVDMNGRPGEILVADKKDWIIACGELAIRINKIVPQGKSEMSGADFLRGCQIPTGTILK